MTERVTSERALHDANAQLEDQAAELELQTTELEAANEELRRANDELAQKTRLAEESRADAESANRAKAEFLATMSHELRTPLNAISGYADLLLLGVRGPITEEQREDIERIRRSGQYLLGLINDVLNFAKLEAGQVALDVRPTSAGEILQGLEDLIRPQADAKGLRLVQPECAVDTMGSCRRGEGASDPPQSSHERGEVHCSRRGDRTPVRCDSRQPSRQCTHRGPGYRTWYPNH